MSLPAQFSLASELTKLAPLSSVVAGKTYEAVMSLARELQSSGSDIFIEEDLAELFGRSRIAPSIATSFKTVVARFQPPSELFERIALFRGAGPTVIRGLTEPPYFSMVIQCSFLVYVHERNSLAAAFAQHFEQAADMIPEGHLTRAVPGVEGIRKSLQACQDQTSAFHWHKFLDAMAAKLGREEEARAIPTVIFRGLISMLPLVQHLPEERMLVIVTTEGVCSIVVWAHLILGLTVHVNIDTDDGSKSEKLGDGPEHIIVDVTEAHPEPSIALLSVSNKEYLFTMKAEPDGDIIDATFKRPLRAYAKRILDQQTIREHGRQMVMDELVSIVCSFAICIGNRLHIVRLPSEVRMVDWKTSRIADDGEDTRMTPDVDISQHESEDEAESAYDVPSKERIILAAQMLFDDRKIKTKQVNHYAALYTGQALTDIENPPKAIASILEAWGEDGQTPDWTHLCLVARLLSVLVLAVAHVTDIDASAGLLLCESVSLLSQSKMMAAVNDWNGRNPISIDYTSWFEIISLLMVGHSGQPLDLENTSLLSDSGWSIYVNTFGDADAAYLEPGQITVKQGVPWRNGIWKHRVRDAARTTSEIPWDHPERANEISMKCAVPMGLGRPFVGENGDSFVVSLRMLPKSSKRGPPMSQGQIARRTGYNELWVALMSLQKTKGCSHIPQSEDNMNLEPGWLVTSGCEDYKSLDEDARLIICLTACNPVARWRALLGIKETSRRGHFETLLRTADCCFRCAVDQALREFRSCYLVL